MKVLSLLFLCILTGSVSGYATQRMSVDDMAVLIGNDYSLYPVLTRDGRFSAFVSAASNLTPNDDNDDNDIFVHDMQNGNIERVTVPGVDNLHLAPSSRISMSDDGRYIVFVSSMGLVENDDNDKYDVYLIDRSDQSLKLVSMRKADNLVGDGNSMEASISGDGRYIVFMSTSEYLLPLPTTTYGNIFVYDMEYGGVVWNASKGLSKKGGNGGCRYPHITENGSYIVFESHASDLVAGDDNDQRDFFIVPTAIGSSPIRINARLSSSSNSPSDSSISDDGRYVVFDSELDDLVPNDTNGVVDVFIYDKTYGAITRLDVDDVQGTLAKFSSQISGDGNYITYLSGATPAERHVYRYSRVTDSVEDISVNSNGYPLDNESRHAVMNFDGKLIAFGTQASNVTPFDTNKTIDIVLHDSENNSTDILSGHTPRSNDSSGDITSLTQDGRYVAFYSSASNLVQGDTNDKDDVFVRDTIDNTIERVSIATDGTQGNSTSKNPSISSDGRYVVFQSFADNLTSYDTNNKYDIFLHDRKLRTTICVSKKRNGSESFDNSENPTISADGNFVLFKSYEALDDADTNGKEDIYVHNLTNGVTELVSIASDGGIGDGASTAASISGAGRYITFASLATNFSPITSTVNRSNIFIRDRQNGVTTLISPDYTGSEASGNSLVPSISENAKFVVFQSTATDLLSVSDTNNKTDIFLYNRLTDSMKRVTNATDGSQSNEDSLLTYGLSINEDGRYLVFRSGASNLVDNDTNGVYDAFLYDRKNEFTIRLSMNDNDEEGNDRSYAPSISPDGSVTSYRSSSKNLVLGDNNNKGDIFTSENNLYSPPQGGSFLPAIIMLLLN